MNKHHGRIHGSVFRPGRWRPFR